jgi:hypothetical protein
VKDQDRSIDDRARTIRDEIKKEFDLASREMTAERGTLERARTVARTLREIWKDELELLHKELDEAVKNLSDGAVGEAFNRDEIDREL